MIDLANALGLTNERKDMDSQNTDAEQVQSLVRPHDADGKGSSEAPRTQSQGVRPVARKKATSYQSMKLLRQDCEDLKRRHEELEKKQELGSHFATIAYLLNSASVLLEAADVLIYMRRESTEETNTTPPA